MSDEKTAYLPIEDYGAIGNLRTAALVGRNGSIDWCCLPRFDRGSVFGGLLDHRRGGHFRIAPPGAPRGDQEYLENTNVLETRFRAGGATVVVSDWMPLRGSLKGRGHSEAEPMVSRWLRVEGGAAEVEVEWAPRLDYARAPTELAREGAAWVATNREGHRLDLMGLQPEDEVAVETDAFGPVLRFRLRLEPGEERFLTSRWGDEGEQGRHPEACRTTLDETCEAWREWAGINGAHDWAGEHAGLIARSKLALKLLTFSESGAIAAAATTSLPEDIGGVRNWDYRYSWIRDASLTAQALLAIGHPEEASDFVHWAERVSELRAEEGERFRLMYGLDGELDLEEAELDHLEGYRGSSPVRVGNAAADQRQLDIYGELLGSAAELVRMGEDLSESLSTFLTEVADEACSRWHEPDDGIWEIRDARAHYTYSKVMVWMALDRALWLAERGQIEGDAERWRETRKIVRKEILDRGLDSNTDAFSMTFGDAELDAANLLLPIYGFLEPEDPRLQATIDRTLEELTENGLVYRYRIDDGLPGEEGAFVLCSFWLVDALALSGRTEEARKLFDRLAKRVNHVGLFSEQIDPRTGAFLGNFPQAFSHIGLINSVTYLVVTAGGDVPGPTPLGFRGAGKGPEES